MQTDDMIPMVGQVLASQQAEEALLGIMLVNPDAVVDCQELVKVDDFMYSKSRQIFDAIDKLSDIGQQIDVVTVGTFLKDDDLFQYMVDIASRAMSVVNLKSYAKIVTDYAVKRRVMAMATSVSKYIFENDKASKDDVVNFAQTAMIDFESSHEDGVKVTEINKAIKDYVVALDARFRSDTTLTGFSSGFEAIDAVTNGWRRGELIIIAGRPSMGKTTYALQTTSLMSVNQGLNGLFFSLEMSNDQLMEKLIACHGQCDLEFLKSPSKYRRQEEMWPRVEYGARMLKDKPFNIIHCPGIHINQLKTYARKAHRKKPLDYIAIDHIHLMNSDGQSRERQLASISGALKTLAGQLNIPVIALAQLNRGVEQRQDKRPMMSDLRDSGSIEQDADIIQFVYRDDYYNEGEMSPNRKLVLIDTVKHRMGQNGPAFFENRYDQSRLVPTQRVMQFEPKGNASKYLDRL